jgi:hypothetical protein
MAEGEAPLVEADPRTRGNFAYRSGERGNFKTDGMDSRPLIHGLAMGPGCVEQHPNKAWRVRDGSYNDRDRLSKECVRGVRYGWQRASGDAPATEACAGARLHAWAAALRGDRPLKIQGKAAAAEAPADPNRRELEANMFSVVHARNKPAKYPPVSGCICLPRSNYCHRGFEPISLRRRSCSTATTEIVRLIRIFGGPKQGPFRRLRGQDEGSIFVGR